VSHPVKVGHDETFLVVSVDEFGMGDSGGHAVWSLTAELSDEGLTARTKVLLGPDSVEPSLADLFEDMAQNWRGWNGTKDWQGMEGGLALSCVHDGLGHVGISVELRHLSGAGWVARSDIGVDAGQLDALAGEIRELLGGV
jgi:hypothetical protein